jgi:hypothetical protein
MSDITGSLFGPDEDVVHGGDVAGVVGLRVPG